VLSSNSRSELCFTWQRWRPMSSAFRMVVSWVEMTDSTDTSIRLNSSKHPQAPHWHRPEKIFPTACQSRPRYTINVTETPKPQCSGSPDHKIVTEYTDKMLDNKTRNMCVCTYVCRLLTRIKRTCYTTEDKIMKLQMNKKRTQYTCNTPKTHATRQWNKLGILTDLIDRTKITRNERSSM